MCCCLCAPIQHAQDKQPSDQTGLHQQLHPTAPAHLAPGPTRLLYASCLHTRASLLSLLWLHSDCLMQLACCTPHVAISTVDRLTCVDTQSRFPVVWLRVYNVDDLSVAVLHLLCNDLTCQLPSSTVNTTTCRHIRPAHSMLECGEPQQPPFGTCSPEVLSLRLPCVSLSTSSCNP